MPLFDRQNMETQSSLSRFGPFRAASPTLSPVLIPWPPTPWHVSDQVRMEQRAGRRWL